MQKANKEEDLKEQGFATHPWREKGGVWKQEGEEERIADSSS